MKAVKYTCILHSETINGWKPFTGANPIDSYKGNNEEKFLSFINKNKKKKIIGYISYDFAYKNLKIKKTVKNLYSCPIFTFYSFNQNNNSNIDIPYGKKLKSTGFKPLVSRSKYNSSFKKIKNYIKEGDIYQINLTYPLQATTNIDSEELFKNILINNKVDHAAYIDCKEFEVLSASPERFIKIKNGIIETCPVKGTRKRGPNRAEDEKLKKELIENEKEAAELNMITDLLRNDIGKVSTPGSVRVLEHRLLQKCDTVWHTYSRIRGKLIPKLTPIKALLSMLPGGSITGCPKKRAVEVIDELEIFSRGVYTGCIVSIEPNGDLDSSIAIRTIIKKDDKLILQVGGGIVLNSDENSEYDETLHKAASFMKIL